MNVRIESTTTWEGRHYSAYRVLLGLYLTLHFAQLLPFGSEVFSAVGALPQAESSPLTGLFPNLLVIWDSPLAVQLLLGLACLASLALAAGWRDRWAAVYLAYLWACLLGRNPLIANPSIPYVGWLLVAHVFVPSAPPGSLDAWRRRRAKREPEPWSMPADLRRVAWIVLALSYSYSGYTKLGSPSWMDGSALQAVLENPLARPGTPREILLGLPPRWLQIATGATLGLELFFAPLALSSKLRPWLWCAMVGLHLNLIVLLDFADLSVGMLMMHAFTSPFVLRFETSQAHRLARVQPRTTSLRGSAYTP